jgi:molecular chaperone DnaK (HSP70)
VRVKIMASCIGIDLGTSTTCVSVIQNGEPAVISGIGGSTTIPSYVYLRDDSRILIGEEAKSEVIADPYNTIWATKRLMGRRFDDEGVQSCIKRLPYNIEGAPNGDIRIKSRGQDYNPEWVASLILKFALKQASTVLNENVKKAVLTVPGTFTKEQRVATKRAAEKIGIEVMRIISEPTAAALSCGFHKNIDQTIAIFDLGGGTFDVAVMQIAKGKYKTLSTRGKAWLGGEDFDNILVDKIVKEFKKKFGINIYSDKISHQRLKTAAEKAKIDLSINEDATIYIPSIAPDINQVADVNRVITRDEFEKMVAKPVNICIDTFKSAVSDADLKMEDLDNIILVGGMTRMPFIRQKLEEMTQRSIGFSYDPDEAVARGAAVHAGAMTGQKICISVPCSNKPKDEYLSGDIDIHAMYDEVLCQQEDDGDDNSIGCEWNPNKDQMPAEVSMANPTASENSPQKIPPHPNKEEDLQFLLEVFSKNMESMDMSKLFQVMPDDKGQPKWVQGGFQVGQGMGEGVKIKMYQTKNGDSKRTLVGEFVIQGVQSSFDGSTQLSISYNIDKDSPFAVNAPNAANQKKRKAG